MTIAAILQHLLDRRSLWVAFDNGLMRVHGDLNKKAVYALLSMLPLDYELQARIEGNMLILGSKDLHPIVSREKLKTADGPKDR